MNCKRCNKEIKNPRSVKHGYGPVCWIKTQKGNGVESKRTTEKEHIELGDKKTKIRIKRVEIL